MTAPLFSSPLLSTPVLAAVNHVLDQAGWARKLLQPYAGRSIRIAMQPFSLSFAIDSAGCLQASTASADLDIVLPAAAPLLAMQGSEAVMKAAQISGPADLANTLNFVLRHLRWDIEEDLSKVIGDIAAHRVVSAFEAFTRWQGQAGRNLAENIGEYLVEENPTLVTASSVASFAGEVERLRSDLAMLEQRVARLFR